MRPSIAPVPAPRSGAVAPLTAGRAAALVAALAGALAAMAIALAAPAAAQEPIPCGTLYRVQPGDTLHSIAVRAYGEGDYLAIFEANRDILPNATRIEVGNQLLIPCLDGTGPQTRAELVPAPGSPDPGPSDPGPTGGAAPEGAVGGRVAALAAIPPEREIRVLTGTDFAPFVDPALPEGGLTTEIVRLSLDRATFGRPLRIGVAEDWSAHLDLLEEGRFDLGYPWYRPDCDRAGGLGPSMQRRCAEFTFSAPLYEVEVAWYARAGDALIEANGHEALRDRRLCRPATYFTFDLRQQRLMPPAATLVFPSTAEECFVLLEAGVVDAVSLARAVAEREVTRLGLEGRVAEIPALAASQTLHVIAHKSSPEAQAFLAALDSGLAEIRDSGRWYEVVARHLGPLGMSLR